MCPKEHRILTKMVSITSKDPSFQCFSCCRTLVEAIKGNTLKRIFGVSIFLAAFYFLTNPGVHGDILVYEFKANEPSHLEPVNMETALRKTGKLVSIDVAHTHGFPHCGNWIHVVDSLNRTLVLKRGPNLVTCANAWGLVGEHAIGDETPLETTKRGIREELGTKVLDLAIYIGPLNEYPLYYFRSYGPSNMNRVDRQLTFIWLVQLSLPGEGVPLNLDHEVVDHKWLTITELEHWVEGDQQRIIDGVEPSRLCHDTIVQLLEITAAKLKRRLEEEASQTRAH